MVLFLADVVGVDVGRRIMRNRKPVNVKNFSQLHNLIMFFLSLYMVIETVTQVRQLLSQQQPVLMCPSVLAIRVNGGSLFSRVVAPFCKLAFTILQLPIYLGGLLPLRGTPRLTV